MTASNVPAASASAQDRRLGILLAQAVGDALGAGTEFQTPAQIAARYGAIRDYVQGVNHGFRPGEFTHDTHMLLCILGAHWDARLRGADLAEAAQRRFLEWLQAGPPDVGNATRSSLHAARQHGLAGGLVSWERGGFSAAGNGALMRAAASVVAGTRGEALRREAVELAALTHPDPRSLAACWVLVAALEALQSGAAPLDAWRLALDEVEQAPLAALVAERFGSAWTAQVEGRLGAARAAVRDAVEHGLSGAWRSQSGFVIDTLEAAVAASLVPAYLDGILPVVARGDDSDTVAAVAGGALGARGLLPPDELVARLRCDFSWPTWPPAQTAAGPVLAAFVPPPADAPTTDPDTADDEEAAAYRRLPTLPRFEYSEVAPRVYAGRAPLFRREVWRLRALGVTHILDLREEHEWSGAGRYGASAVDEIRRLGLPRLCVTVTDMGAPLPGALDRAAAFVDAALHLGGTVYVHCRAGMERTAAVVVAWYGRAHGCSAKEALERLRERRPAFAPLAHQLQAAHAWLVKQPRR